MINTNDAGYAGLLNALFVSAAEILNLEKGLNADVTFTGGKKIRGLNLRFRGIDKVTDVLSFPMNEKFLGDIVICRAAAKKQAQKYGHSLEREIGFLFVHGLLHLLGYSHENSNREQIMNGLTEQILAENDLKR